MQFTFRKATLQDAKGIASLIQQNFNVKSLKEAEEFFKKDLKGGMNYVLAEEKDRVVGFATWKEHDRVYHELAELHAIAVDEAFKGKGLAKKLFNKLLEEIKHFYSSHKHSLRKLYVLAHANNKRAIKFYKKVGFKEEVVIPSHYYANVDEVLLSMYFKQQMHAKYGKRRKNEKSESNNIRLR